MERENRYLFSLILVGCLFLFVIMLAPNRSYGSDYDNVVADVTEQHTINDVDVDIDVEHYNNVYGSVGNMGSTLRGNITNRSRWMSSFLTLFLSLMLLGYEHCSYLKINNKIKKTKPDFYKKTVRRGPPKECLY